MWTIAGGILVALFVVFVVLPLAVLLIMYAIGTYLKFTDWIDKLAARLHMRGEWLVAIPLVMSLVALALILWLRS